MGSQLQGTTYSRHPSGLEVRVPLLGAGSEESTSTSGSQSPMHATAINAQKLYHALIAQALPKDSAPLISGAASSVPDCAADISYVTRQVVNTVTSADYPAFQLAGQTTGFNIVQGGIAAAKAYSRWEEAVAKDNKWGKREAVIDMFRGAFQGIGGLYYTALRPLNIYTLLHGIDTSMQANTLIGRVTYGVGAVGNGLFGLFYATIAVWTALAIRKSSHFKGKLRETAANTHVSPAPKTLAGRVKAFIGIGLTPVERLKPYMKFLGDKRLHTTGENTFDKLHRKALRLARKGSYINPRVSALDNVKKELREEAAPMVKLWMRTLYNQEITSSSLTDQECEQKAEKLFAEIDTEKERNTILEQLGFTKGTKLHGLAQGLSLEELIGLGIATAKRGLRKESKLAQVSSQTFVRDLKASMDSRLLERLESSDPFTKKAAEEEAQALMQKLKTDLVKNNGVNAFLFLSGVFGFIATILSFVCTAGMGAIASNILFLGTAACMLPADFTLLISGIYHSTGKPGRFDKLLTGANTALGLASLATLVTLGLVFGGAFTFGTMPMAVALGVCCLFILSNSASIIALQWKEWAYNSANPTLESLKKTVSHKKQTDRIDQEVHSLLKHLPKSDRGRIKAAIAGTTERNMRELISNEDKALDWNHRFGENFFDKDPMHADVLKAVENKCRENETPGVRALLERMRAFKKERPNGNYTAEQITEIKACFAGLSHDERTGLAQKIYNRRAKHPVSQRFKYEPVTNGQFKAALEEVLTHKHEAMQARREAERASDHLLYKKLSLLQVS